MPRQMKAADQALFRAVVTMKETFPEGFHNIARVYDPVVFGPHATLGPVKGAVTRFKRGFRNETTGRKADGSYGWMKVERTFEVDYQTVTVEWKSIEA